MPQGDDLTIRVQTLNGPWEVFGVDRAGGVWPEDFTASSNEWGNDKAAFNLRRNPGVMWPDLQAFSPVEVEIGGVLIWTGRVLETPARDGDDPVINVQCEGWQYHLDDDPYTRHYIHTRLSDWKDHRTLLGTDLVNHWPPRALVNSADGQITIGYASGVSWVQNRNVGVTLDLGPQNNRAKHIIIKGKRGPGAPSTVDLRAASTSQGQPWPFVSQQMSDHLPLDTTTLTSTALGSFPQTERIYTTSFDFPGRYVHVYLRNTGATYTTGNDDTFIITGIALSGHNNVAVSGGNFGDTLFLYANKIVADARATALPLISTDETKIAATSFNIPEFEFAHNPQTAREVIQAANAFHNYKTQVDVQRRLVFQPRPTTPLFEIGAWGGSTFEDSSMNSGKDIYNSVQVQGSGPDGSPLIETANSATGSTLSARADQQPHSVGGSYASPAANTTMFNILPVGTGSPVTPNTVYELGGHYELRFKASVASGTLPVRYRFGDINSFLADFTEKIVTLTTTEQEIVLNWAPKARAVMDESADYLWQHHAQGSSGQYNFRDAKVFTGTTILDRYGFRRSKVLPVQASLTSAAAVQIGSVYLAGHKTQPLTGQVTVQPGGVREIAGGTPHPAHLLLYTQELLRLGHRIDPDTGAVGRDGTIASVSYAHNERTSTVALDSTRRNFEAMLARLSVIQSSRGM